MKASRVGICAQKNGSATGKGLYSSVYKGRVDIPAADGKGGTETINVAVKEYLLPVQQGSDPEAQALTEEALTFLLEDIEELLVPVAPHPNLARVYGVEYAPGMHAGNLDRVLLTCDWVEHAAKLKGPLSEKIVRHHIRGALRGLAHLHAAGLSHDDLRPCNVLPTNIWEAPGRANPEEQAEEKAECLAHPVVVDYAIFKKIQTILDPMGGNATTKQKPNYCAPEIFTDGGDYDAEKTDIWSLAAVCLELLAGKIPFAELDPTGRGNIMFKIIQGKAPPKYPEGLGPEAKAFLNACFARDHGARPSAEEALTMAWFQ